MPVLVAVNYHYIRKDFSTPYPGIFGLTPEQFELQLLQLGKLANFVSGKDIIAHIEGERQLPELGFVITFDDGLAEQYDLALPVLDKLNIPALFFTNTENVVDKRISLVHKVHMLLTTIPFDEYRNLIYTQAKEAFGKSLGMEDREHAHIHYEYDTPERAELKYFLNFCLTFQEQEEVIGSLFRQVSGADEREIAEKLYMSEDQVKNLSGRGYLGTHSHRHIPLGLYDAEEIEQDIEKSVKLLRELTGRDTEIISYPYGARNVCTPDVFAICKKLGLKAGFTMERAANADFDEPLALSRFDCNDVPGGKFCQHSPGEFFNRTGIASWYKVMN